MSKRYPGGIIRKTPQTPSQTSAQGIWDMASVTQAVKENTWPIAGVPDPISKSLRFRSSASAYLNRTPASAGNRKTWTFSAWVKRGTLGSVGTILHCYDGSSSRRSVIQFNSDNTIGWDQGGGGTSGLIDTVAVYRDPSAWYHLVCVANYSNGTAANRALIYINGVLQAVTTADDFDNADGLINSTNAHQIGSQGGSSNFFDGYMTEVYLIDGQALTPSSFGNTNDQTGVWQPIAYTGTYGTNGFYLPFSNTASTTTLGYDFSGNSNNWTTNNISLTTGTSIQTFSTVGTTSWTAPTGVTSVNYLVVAGGGGGGGDANSTGGGGGGGGGYRTGTLTVVPGIAYTVTVGAGGAGGATGRGSSGSNSVFSTITSTGGGGGGGSPYDSVGSGASGGSGGGGKQEQLGGAGTSGQGNAGGNSNSVYGAAGGGGAGGAAANTASGTNQPATAGGAGVSNSISGTAVTYSGGGGGGNGNGNAAANGTDGGGNGVNSGTGGDGAANRGGGGGGAGGAGSPRNGGAGGSGIVILSWTSGATATYDSMNDVPTQWIPYNTTGDVGALWRGNYAVWNSLPAVGSTSKPTYSQGNLTVAFPSFGYAGPLSTLSLPTQNTYCEITCASVGGGGYSGVGIAELFADLSGNVVPTKCVTYGPNGGKTVSGAFSSYGSSFTTGDIIGIAYDYSGNQVTFYKNNVSQGALSLSSLSGALFFCCHATSGAITWTANFGQRPFSYTPPSGFKTLNTTNLPTPTIGATASTQADDYFNAVLYSGNNSTQNIAVGFQPDWVWSKCRNVGRSHRLSDAVRGSTRDLYSDTTDAEQNDGSITSFISTGFSLNNATGSAYNTSGENYVSWAWKANGTGSSNTAGSITSTVSANTTAGFSIVTYTGTGSAATIGHGLGVAPSMMIVKRRNGAANWFVYHSALGATQYIYLDATAAAITASGAWNNTAPTSTVFSVGNFGEVNLNTGTYVAYCFAQVAGYSAMGSYTGNGSSDGTFIYTGFRPRFVMIKQSSSSNYWWLKDSARSPTNQADLRLAPNLSNAESNDAAFNGADFLSNGFKLRGTDTTTNQSGGTYIYVAFAESPFKFALAR